LAERETGEGVREWLDEILFGSLEPGRTTLDIDYAHYARAEAALAWLNLSFHSRGPGGLFLRRLSLAVS